MPHISHRYGDTTTYSPKIANFAHPLLFSALVWGDPLRTYEKALRFLKLESSELWWIVRKDHRLKRTKKQFLRLLFITIRPNFSQGCGLGLDVSVWRQSQDVLTSRFRPGFRPMRLGSRFGVRAVRLRLGALRLVWGRELFRLVETLCAGGRRA